MRVLRGTSYRSFTIAGGVAAGLSLAALSASASVAASAQATELSRGHVDVVGVEVVGDAFDVHVHDEDSGTEYAPEDVVLRALPGSAYTVPSGSCYAFLGAAGDTVHRLPQVQDQDLLWPGISSHVEDGVLADDALTVELTGASGPGDFSVYASGLCPADSRLFDSGDGIGADDAVTLAAHDHQHANWAFTEPGAYTLTFTVSGTLADGTELAPVSADLAFTVG